ncbi:MAG: hypothetical protein ACHQET_09920 [Chitinophagales bacterium]
MKSLRWLSLVLLLLGSLIGRTQNPAVLDSVQFFIDEKPVEATLNMDMRYLMGEKPQGTNSIPGTITMKLSDTSTVTEQIRINTRGHMRRETCYIPPMRLYFRNATSPKLSPLHTLKLIVTCKTGTEYEQYLLKEFICYKIYNLISDMSFRVRLMHMTYVDSKGKKKPITGYAFLLESTDALAKRNHCKEYKLSGLATEMTDRKTMTTVSVFEYLIANTDWAVPVRHNIVLLKNKKDSTIRPYAVGYDFDYAGLVNTDYAIPDPKLEIESVTQRLYRGFPRTVQELTDAFKVFIDQKNNIYNLIKNFEPLSVHNKKDMVDYLDEFYRTINDKVLVKDTFIDNARKE